MVGSRCILRGRGNGLSNVILRYRKAAVILRRRNTIQAAPPGTRRDSAGDRDLEAQANRSIYSPSLQGLRLERDRQECPEAVLATQHAGRG